MPLFDDAQENCFDICSTVFAYDVIWTPSLTGIPEKAKAFFNFPTNADNVDTKTRFWPTDHELEYRIGFFDTLFERVREGENEVIEVLGLPAGMPSLYYVAMANASWDGKSIKCKCDPKLI